MYIQNAEKDSLFAVINGISQSTILNVLVHSALCVNSIFLCNKSKACTCCTYTF